MSDDKVRLWRYARHGARIPEWSDVRGYEGDDGVPYIARPVADDDAREERIEKLRDEGFAMYAAHGDMTRDRDEWKARAEKAEARCREIAQKIIDRIGAVGPENAEEALERLFRCDHTNAITLKRTDEARCAAVERAERAEAVISDALAIDKGERMERPQPHHPLLSVMAGNRASLAEFAAWARKAEAERDSARALLREARPCVAANYGPNEGTQLLARIDAEAGGGK